MASKSNGTSGDGIARSSSASDQASTARKNSGDKSMLPDIPMPCKRRRPHSLMEDHFEVDEDFALLGALQHDPNLQRDVHDWFNIIALVPLVILNFMNWTCPELPACGVLGGKATVIDLWVGAYFSIFWWSSLAYFLTDLLFVLLLPKCVRSPGVIVAHHVVTILYIMMPAMYKELEWLMGSCMMVELNTWFLIARRSFNKMGSKPFKPGVSVLKSLRLIVISWCFYITWFVIRLFIYPYLMMVIVGMYQDNAKRTGNPFHPTLLCPTIHAVLICLNVKWTFDMFRSKMKGNKKSKGL